MPPKKKTKFVYPIEKKDEFYKIISEENHRLSVIDIHLAWCGPCEAMQSNYQSLWFSFDQPEERIEFWTASQEIVAEETLASLQSGPLTCKPRFLIYVAGEKKAEISGCDFTALNAAISKYIPVIED